MVNRSIIEDGLLGRSVYFLTIILSILFFLDSLRVGGVTWDEIDGLRILRSHLDVLIYNIPLNKITNDLIYYGVTNIIPVVLLYYLGYFLGLGSNSFEQYFTDSHIVIFTLGLVTSYLLVLIMRLFKAENNIVYLPAILLLLYPNWIGSSFFNFKDIPSAFCFTMYTYASCLYVRAIIDPSKQKYTIFFLLSGGILCSIKIAFLTVSLVACFLLAFINFYHQKLKTTSGFIYCGVSYFLMIILIALLLTPGAWHEPLTYIINDMKLMSKHEWDSCTNIINNCINVHGKEWNSAGYLLLWYFSQIPALILALFIGGLISIYFYWYKNYKLLLLPILVQLMLLPLVAMCINSVFYDGTRHTLFCLPMIVLISGLGVQYYYMLDMHRIFKYFMSFVCAILCIILIIDNIKLSPYQYSYFNELMRRQITSYNTDTDYWGFSMREIMLSIKDHNQATTSIPEVKKISGIKMIGLKQAMSSGEYFNLVCLNRKNQYVAEAIEHYRLSCKLNAIVGRRLLFKDDELVLSKLYLCQSRSAFDQVEPTNTPGIKDLPTYPAYL